MNHDHQLEDLDLDLDGIDGLHGSHGIHGMLAPAEKA